MKVKISEIRLDGDTQARQALSTETVVLYAEQMKEGAEFPPVVVFNDGSNMWLADGFHRYFACMRIGASEINALVKQGTVIDARIYSFSANGDRGLSLTAADVRANIIKMLSMEETKSWTDTQIAKHVRSSSMTVGRIRASMGEEAQAPVRTFIKKDGTEGKIDTSKRKERQPKQDPKPQEGSNTDHLANELADTVNDLSAENQRLKDAIAVGQWDASDIEKIDAQETIAELREKIRLLEIDNAALRDSRDMFQNRNAELMATVKSLQAKLKKFEAA